MYKYLSIEPHKPHTPFYHPLSLRECATAMAELYCRFKYELYHL